MTTDKKYQIFISSTYNDLVEERNTIVKACLEMGHIPIGMEMFNAGSADQWKTISRTIDQCDYYAVVVGRRYGSTTTLNNRSISYTEREFEYAMEKRIPVLGFPIHDEALRTKEQTDTNQSEVNNFRQRLCTGRTVDFWRSADDLKAKFIVSLVKEIQNSPRTGWVQANQAASPEVANEIARLSKENETLRLQLGSDPSVRVNKVLAQLKAIPLDLPDAAQSKYGLDDIFWYWSAALRRIASPTVLHRDLQSFFVERDTPNGVDIHKLERVAEFCINTLYGLGLIDATGPHFCLSELGTAALRQYIASNTLSEPSKSAPLAPATTNTSQD